MDGNEYSYAGYNLREEISKPPTHLNSTCFRGIKTAADLIIYTFLYSFLHNKKTAKGFYTYDGFVNSQTNFVSLNKLECK